MKINCLSCGHTFDLDDEAYDTYEGLVKCFVCRALLDIKIEEGKLRKVRVANMVASSLPESSSTEPVKTAANAAGEGT